MRIGRYAIILAIGVFLATGESFGGTPAAVTVNATVLSKNKCKFNTSATTLPTMTLDPMNPTTSTLSTTLNNFFVCNGASSTASYAISDDRGIRKNFTLQNAGALIPYSFSYTPSSGSVSKGAAQNLTITVTIQGSDYQDAISGTYTDTVTLSIVP